MRTWLQFSDEQSFGRAGASHVGRLARRTLAARPVFRLALSGGNSPLPLFRGLTDPTLFPAQLWLRTHVFFVDERMVAPDHPDSNFGSVTTHLLNRVPIPAVNIHRMRGELPPEQEAREYARQLVRHFGCGPAEIPTFDLIVLGMGADGHTASLFPGTELSPVHPLVAPVPPPRAKPHVARLTLTPQILNAAREILFMISGADKHSMLRAIRSGDRTLPASRIDVRPQSWYLYPALTDNNPSSHGRSHGRF